MLKKIIRDVTNKLGRLFFYSNTTTSKVIIKRENHCISRKEICPNALGVLYKIRKHNYQAYLVGGCVRDLLVGMCPKDFDIVTDARPDQIRNIFLRNSRIIGRRFKLVHVYTSGSGKVEVVTFRANHKGTSSSERKSLSSGMLVRDNVYGTMDEDCLRRDFTINALYYNIDDFSIVDFTNGLEDIKNKVVRIIGDPKKRYREDPVRMLRAIRIAAKLNFNLEKETKESITQLADLLGQVSPSRLYEDCNKMFMSGYAAKTYTLLKEFDLLRKLFIGVYLHQHPAHNKFINKFLEDIDYRKGNSKLLSPAFMYAAMLWPYLNEKKKIIAESEKINITTAYEIAIDKVILEQKAIISIPWYCVDSIKEIWLKQQMFEKINVKKIKKIHKIYINKKLSLSFSFFRLRNEAYGGFSEQVSWWGEYISTDQETRDSMIKKLSPKKDQEEKLYSTSLEDNEDEK